MIKTTTTKKVTTRATISLPPKSQASATFASTETLKMKRKNKMLKKRKNGRESCSLQIVKANKLTTVIKTIQLKISIMQLKVPSSMMMHLAKKRRLKMANQAKRKIPIPSPLLSLAIALISILAVVKTLINLAIILAVKKTQINLVTILAVIKTLNNPVTGKNAYHCAPSTRFSHSWPLKLIGLLTTPSFTKCHLFLPPNVLQPTHSLWISQRWIFQSLLKLSVAWIPLQHALSSTINLWSCQET